MTDIDRYKGSLPTVKDVVKRDLIVGQYTYFIIIISELVIIMKE
jgi:hypothetical protein